MDRSRKRRLAQFLAARLSIIADPEVPDGYVRQLGFNMNNNCYCEITGFKLRGSDTLRFAFRIIGENISCNVLGAYDGATAQTNYSLYGGYQNTPTNKYLRYNGGTYQSFFAMGTRYDVEITPTGCTGFAYDSTWAAQTFETVNNLCIGTTALTATSNKLIGDLYGNVEVVGRGKFIPVERLSDNTYGYYDSFSNTFYPFTGTPVSLGEDI